MNIFTVISLGKENLWYACHYHVFKTHFSKIQPLMEGYGFRLIERINLPEIQVNGVNQTGIKIPL